MIRIFNRNRNAIGQFMVALIFLGTFGFLFMFDGFAAKSEAKSCCGGGEAAMTTFAADSSGDFGSDLPMDAESTDGCCSETDTLSDSESNCPTCIEGVAGCNICSSDNACGGSDNGCKSGSECYNSQRGCRGDCEGKICKADKQCDGKCSKKDA